MNEGTIGCGEKDLCLRCAELMNGLAAGTTRRTGSMIQIDDDKGPDADGGSIKRDRRGNGGLLGADGEAIGCIFDIASSDGLSIVQQQGRSHTELAVWSIGVLRDLRCEMVKLIALLRGEAPV